MLSTNLKCGTLLFKYFSFMKMIVNIFPYSHHHNTNYNRHPKIVI